MSIKEFNPSLIKPPFSALFLGKSGSGKTEQLHRVVYQVHKDHKFDEVHIFSTTCKIYRKEFFYVPHENFHNDIDVDFIDIIVQNQINIAEIKGKEECSKILFLFDDIIGSPFMKSRTMKDLYTAGRHANCSTILLSQSYKQNSGLPTIMRENTNWIFSFFQQNYKQRVSFVEEYLSIKTIKEGTELYKKITDEDKRSIVINCKNVSARQYEEYVYKYKIDINKKVRNFKIGNYRTTPTPDSLRRNPFVMQDLYN